MDWCEGVRFRKVAYLLQCLLGFLNLLCKTVDKSLLFVWFLQATFLIGELCYPVVDHMFRWNFPRYLFFQLFQNLGGMFMWQLGARCYLQGSNLACLLAAHSAQILVLFIMLQIVWNWPLYSNLSVYSSTGSRSYVQYAKVSLCV